MPEHILTALADDQQHRAVFFVIYAFRMTVKYCI